MNLYFLIFILLIIIICSIYFGNVEPFSLTENRARFKQLKNNKGDITTKLNNLNTECKLVNSCNELSAINTKYEDIGGCGKCSTDNQFNYFINENKDKPATTICTGTYNTDPDMCQKQTDISFCDSNICTSIAHKTTCGYCPKTKKVVPMDNNKKDKYDMCTDSPLITDVGICPRDGADKCFKKENRQGPHDLECYNQLWTQITSKNNWVTQDNSNNWNDFHKNNNDRYNSYAFDNSGAEDYKTGDSLFNVLTRIYTSVVGDKSTENRFINTELTEKISRNHRLVFNSDPNICDFKFNELCAEKQFSDVGCALEGNDYYKSKWKGFKVKQTWNNYVTKQKNLADKKTEIPNFTKWKDANYFCYGKIKTQLTFRKGCKVKLKTLQRAKRNYTANALVNIRKGSDYNFHGIICQDESNKKVKIIWTELIPKNNKDVTLRRNGNCEKNKASKLCTVNTAEIQHHIFGNCGFFNQGVFDIPNEIPVEDLEITGSCFSTIDFEEGFQNIGGSYNKKEGFVSIADKASACNDGCNLRYELAKNDIRSDTIKHDCIWKITKIKNDWFCINNGKFKKKSYNIATTDIKCKDAELNTQPIFKWKGLITHITDKFPGWIEITGPAGSYIYNAPVYPAGSWNNRASINRGHEFYKSQWIPLGGTRVLTNLRIGKIWAKDQGYGASTYLDFVGHNTNTGRSRVFYTMNLKLHRGSNDLSVPSHDLTNKDFNSLNNINNHFTHFKISVRYVGWGHVYWKGAIHDLKIDGYSVEYSPKNAPFTCK
jgi:hypothetical protein